MTRRRSARNWDSGAEVLEAEEAGGEEGGAGGAR